MMMCCLLEYFIPLYMYIYVFSNMFMSSNMFGSCGSERGFNTNKSKEKFKTSHHIKCPSYFALLIN